jgi:uncharacterized protein YdaU (DUF1376 family)
MHYYKRNLGDYAKKAGRLSMLQHGAYTLLIDSCYDREEFPTLEQAIEWTWASTTEEREAVQFVLSRFFVLENGVYIQKRIQEELAEYHKKSVTNKRIAMERETNRKEDDTKRAPDVNDSSPNHKPLTKNQEPPTKEKPPLPPDGGKTKAPAIALKTFLDNCKTSSERPMRDYEPLWNWSRTVGLPDEFVALAWAEFCRQMLPGGPSQSKKQADWRKTFRNYVEKNYLKLWALDPQGQFFLTTAGKTAEKFQEQKAA